MRTTTQRYLTELSDEELVAKFQAGDDSSVEVLIDRYRSYTRAKTRAYFLFGATAEDVEQEGLVGLFKAARDYRCDRQSLSPSFRVFAQLCITRQVNNCHKYRQPHEARAPQQLCVDFVDSAREGVKRLAG